MSDFDLANALYGRPSLSGGSGDGVAVTYGTAVSDSENGKVSVILDGEVVGDVVSGEDADNVLTVETSPSVREGDTVMVTLTGTTAKTPVVTAVVGSGDEVREAADDAQEKAETAQETADAKMRTFRDTPTPPYSVGDIWLQGDTDTDVATDTGGSSGSGDTGSTDSSSGSEAQTASDDAPIQGETVSVATQAANLSDDGEGKVYVCVAPNDGIAYDEATGEPLYLHYAWANSADGATGFDMGRDEGDEFAFVGTCENTEYGDPEDYTAYTWAAVTSDAPATDNAQGTPVTRGFDADDWELAASYVTRADLNVESTGIYSTISQTYVPVTSDDYKNAVEAAKNVEAHMDFDTDAAGQARLSLYSSANGAKAVLTNSKLSFMEGDAEVAYIGSEKLYIEDAEVLDTLMFGDWAWIPRDGGHMTLKYVG